MSRSAELEPPVAGKRRLDPVDEQREPRARLQHVELGGRVDGPVQISSPPPQGVGQREQNAPDLLGLLLLERDDVVVDLDRAERLEEQAGAAAGAPVHDSRNRGAMLAADDEHVPAVAIRDDLLLQVLRGVPAAKVGFERPAQPRPLLAKTIAQVRQFRTGIVDDVERRADLAPDIADLGLERRRGLGDRREQGKAAPDLAHGTAGDFDRGQKCRDVDERLRFEDAAFNRQRQQQLVEILGRLQSDLVVAQEASRLGRCGKSRCDGARVGQRLQHRQTRRTGRRLCEAAYRLDDPIVFERPQGTGVHETLVMLVSVRLDGAIAEYSLHAARAQGRRIGSRLWALGSSKIFVCLVEDLARAKSLELESSASPKPDH